MPRGFTENEKKTLKQSIISSSRTLFQQYGLKKTSIDDIVKKSGIAKGSFYTFFPSKEVLFLTIIEELEEETRKQIRAILDIPDAKPVSLIRKILEFQFSFICDHPLLKVLTKEDELLYLTRKLSPKQQAKLFKSDDVFISELFGSWQEKGFIKKIDLRVLSGFFRSLFYINTYKKGIGEDVYEPVIEIYIDMVSKYLVTGETND